MFYPNVFINNFKLVSLSHSYLSQFVTLVIIFENSRIELQTPSESIRKEKLKRDVIVFMIL